MDLKDIPDGAITAIYGPPGCGKTWLALDLMGRVHQADPEALTVWFDTEYRFTANSKPELLTDFGCDPKRMLVYSGSDADDIIKAFEAVTKLIEEGAPVKAVVINTVTGMTMKHDPHQPIGAMAIKVIMLARLARRAGVTLHLITQTRRDLGAALRNSTVYKPAGAWVNDGVDYKINVQSPGAGVEITKVENEEGSDG